MSNSDVPIQKNNPNNRSNPLNVELLREMANNQKEEIKYKQQELALRHREISMTHELSMRNLDIHAEHLRNSPKYLFKFRLLFSFLVIVVLLVTALFFTYCLYSGNKEIVIRVLEIIVTALLSGSSGYVIGKTKKGPPAPSMAETS